MQITEMPLILPAMCIAMQIQIWIRICFSCFSMSDCSVINCNKSLLWWSRDDAIGSLSKGLSHNTNALCTSVSWRYSVEHCIYSLSHSVVFWRLWIEPKLEQDGSGRSCILQHFHQGFPVGFLPHKHHCREPPLFCKCIVPWMQWTLMPRNTGVVSSQSNHVFSWSQLCCTKMWPKYSDISKWRTWHSQCPPTSETSEMHA